MSENFVNMESKREYSPGEKFYTRQVVEQYEALRQNDRYWAWENKVVDHCLGAFQVGDRITDCPVGTGRFMDIYARHGLRLLGIDISPDMLEEARTKVDAAGMVGRVELIQADASSFRQLQRPTNALICFRLLHLISDSNLDGVVQGLAALPSQTIFLQVFTVKDYKFERVAARVLNALRSSEIGIVRKLKYVYRTLRGLGMALISPRRLSAVNQHEQNTFCDVTYSHPLSRILYSFAHHDFHMQDRFECRDKDHLMGESGCYISMIVVLNKSAAS